MSPLLDSIIEEDILHLLKILRERDIEFENEVFLVTGGAGFLGSWICDILILLGARVLCIDNLSTGRLDFIDHLLKDKNFSFIDHDIIKGLPGINGKINYVLHLASRASPEDYMKHPVETALVNSLGTYYALELTRKCDAIFLLTSTSEVYGDAQVIPTPESYWGNVNPIGIRACYDEGKRFAEALALSYCREYGLDVRISRIFNTYGPRLRADGPYARVVTRFIHQALKNEPLTVHGDGSQTRSFTYVRDTIEAHMLILFKEECRGEVINIGNNVETKIIDLAKFIIKLTGSRSSIVFTEPREDDPRRRCPDIAKAMSLLGWKPLTSLEEGLKKTIGWYRFSIS